MATSGWKNPRWAEIQDPIYRHIFQSLEEWTRNPTVQTISTPQSTVSAVYNAVTDRVDQPPPVTIFGDQLIAGNLRSANYVAGSAGWIIHSDGSAEFNNVTVRGALKAGTVASGFLAGLPQFEANSASTTIREGTLFLDSTATAGYAAELRHVTSGPTYTSVGRILVTSTGVFLGALGGKSVGLTSTDGTKALNVNSARLQVEHGLRGGIVAGYMNSSMGRCWIRDGLFSGTTNGSGLLTVSFPSSFENAPRVFLQATSGGGATPLQINATSTTNFTIQGAISTAITGFWVAVDAA